MGLGMANNRDETAYSLKMTGGGITVDRKISESQAQKILRVVMGVGADVSEPDDERERRSAQTETTTPKKFMTDKRPRTDAERVTCLAYYLSHFRETPQFKTAEITATNVDAAQKPLSNPTVAVNDAANKYNFLAPAGSGRKQITARGEAVVEALPDREKVKAALEDHPMRKARKKNKKSK
jgi:hypothetical protein